MQVKELGSRAAQIYGFTILVGTLFSSIGLGVYNLDISIFVAALFFGSIITGVLSFPNLFIIYFGLKWIYKKSENEHQKNRYFFYLWMIIFLFPIVVFFILITEGNITHISITDLINPSVLLPFPYIIAALYYLFKINRKFDQKYHLHFNQNELDLDILDADLD